MEKRLIILVIVILFSPSAVFASDYEVKRRVADYTIDVRIDKNPPARGENNIDIAVKDVSLRPVTDAQVVIEYLMPSFPGRPPMMDYSTTAKPSVTIIWLGSIYLWLGNGLWL